MHLCIFNSYFTYFAFYCAESKPNSESVEVILTSPSSVEVLSSSSRLDSQYTNEFVSPLQSPEEAFL